MLVKKNLLYGEVRVENKCFYLFLKNLVWVLGLDFFRWWVIM